MLRLLLLAAGALVAPLALVAQPRPADEPPAVLVSRQLLEAERLAVGDLIQLSGDPSGRAPRTFRIAGTYEPTPDPMRLTAERLEARLHLPDLVALTADPGDPLAAESVGAINVALADPREADRFARDLAARVPGLIVEPTRPAGDRVDPFVVLERFHLAIAVITVIGAAVFLLALMVMLADERRETIGTLRLIGFSRRRVLLQVLAEGALVATAGAAFGILFAWATEAPLNRFFQWRYDTALVFVRITPGVIVQSVLMAGPLGIAASLIASWTFLRRQPLALLRR
jgi:putative ABC transport system permease protein